ncbi:hypothetical protein U0035_00840 [Niabella yanshanensis]|uniref:Uncharacterized protein n=1 Tax=Niabella yanshanensis TaxID=577386 RepID=A0ABZ0W5W0_9BACT|nr:hypothetical protein [Niabella yanshanensis]WQD38688.1 hypothetical protein U0035_00840 [Niabella yanshanensis]
MKATILCIAFGLASTTIFAQQAGGKAIAGSSSAIKTKKADVKGNGSARVAISTDAPGKTVNETKEVTQKANKATGSGSVNNQGNENGSDKNVLSAGNDNKVMVESSEGKSTITGNGEATISADHVEKTGKTIAELAQDTKDAAEGAVNEAGNKAKVIASNTNASVSLEAISSSGVAVKKDNNALSAKNNIDVTMEKEIKGENIVKAEQKLENTAIEGLHKAEKTIKSGSANAQSHIKNTTDPVSKSAVAAKSGVQTMLKSKPIKAAVNTKTITGLQIR